MSSRMMPVLRNLLVVLALVGLFGQSTVRAMPMQALEPAVAAATSADPCAEMEEMAAASDQAPAEKPCKSMSGECISKMGCALTVSLPIRAAADAAPVRYRTVAYDPFEEAHPGLSVTPELFPPITFG